MKTIPLTHGKVALVDDGDVDCVSQFKWNYAANGYAMTAITPGRGGKKGYLHRLIVGDVPDGFFVDHINGDPLDNRRANLRIVTPEQNTINRRVRRDSRSGIKGVSLWTSGRWLARIKFRGKKMHLGMFDTAAEAKAAYDAAAAIYFGAFARA